MTAFAVAVEALFSDDNLAATALYVPVSGPSQQVRVIARRGDAVTEFGEARLWSAATVVDVRVSEVAAPRPGERIEIGPDAYVIQGEPVRDRERLVWTLDLRPA